MRIILDTNFLIYCAKQKIDYAHEIEELLKLEAELVTPFHVLKELEKIKGTDKKYSNREAANLALKLLELNKVKIFKIKARYADEAILKLSKNNIVATVDLNLRRRVNRAIVIIGKRKLGLVGL